MHMYYYIVGMAGDNLLVYAEDSFDAKLYGIKVFDSKLVTVEPASQEEVEYYWKYKKSHIRSTK